MAATLDKPVLNSLEVELSLDGSLAIEAYVRQAADLAGLAERQLDRLLYAVNELVEAVVTLASSAGVTGRLRIGAQPYPGWIRVDLTMPAGIPLDPLFDLEDPLLADLPAMRVLPDVFWKRLLQQWIDKAQWVQGPRETTVSLTQFRRARGRANEQYYLGLTPSRVPGLKLDLLENGLALAVTGAEHAAFSLSPKAAYILGAVDGRTPIREIYRGLVREHGLTHPRNVGRLVEDMIRKGLMTPGEPLTQFASGPWASAARHLIRLASLKYVHPRADPLVTRLNRWIGPLWGVAGVVLALVLPPVALGLAFHRGLPAATLERALSDLATRPSAWAWLYLGLAACLLLHELAHALACKRRGGHIHAVGVMVYCGMPCAFVDTTDSWRFPRRRRVMVSLAGPLSDLAVGGLCLLLWGVTIGIARELWLTLALVIWLLSLLNLNPLLETDGYYMLQDALDVVNLRTRAFAALREAPVAFRQGLASGLAHLRAHATLCAYAAASLVVSAALILGTLWAALNRQGSPPLLRLLSIAITLLFLLKLGIEAAIRHYRRTHVTEIDLNPI